MISNLNHQDRKPLLYLITNRRAFHRSEDQIEAIRRAAKAGCDLIQIREKDLGAHALCDFVRKAIAVARPFGARVLVNDRLDVAMAVDADGVHLRVNSLPVREIRRVVTEKGLQKFLIIVSTHSPAEVRSAEAEGADFVVYGPVYATVSKIGLGSPVGIESLAGICKTTGIPVLALGGINLANFREVLESGPAGIAAIGLFRDSDRIEQNIETIFNAKISS